MHQQSTGPDALADDAGVQLDPVEYADTNRNADARHAGLHNFVADNDYAPPAGTDSATAVADSGVACGWVDETSGAILSVAVAKPVSADLTSLRASAQAGSSAVLPFSNATGYFSTAGGIGELQVFSGPYWIVISSADFSATGDVQPIAADVIPHVVGP
jgi:hypothetical protein